MEKELSPLSESVMASLGMCLFALFVHMAWPIKIVSACGLLLTVLAVFHGLKTQSSPGALLGVDAFSSAVVGYGVCGIFIGIALGALYRWGYGLTVWQIVIGSFAPVAAMIGATEEILFRGYIQGRVQAFGTFLSMVFASLCHTAYKCALFVFPQEKIQIDFLLFAACTFLVGLCMGLLRHRAKSTLPAVAAHACFDIIAYGEMSKAPWWVWS